MQVKPGDNAIDYQDMPFAFCSLQCKERFLANPHLYIGYPGQKAPKQEGHTVLKHRRRAFVHESEELQIDSMEVTPPHHY